MRSSGTTDTPWGESDWKRQVQRGVTLFRARGIYGVMISAKMAEQHLSHIIDTAERYRTYYIWRLDGDTWRLAIRMLIENHSLHWEKWCHDMGWKAQNRKHAMNLVYYMRHEDLHLILDEKTLQ